MDVTFDQWRDRLAKRSQPQKTYSVEQIDNLVLPFIERQLPEVYTDTNVRFNRKAADHGAVEYTVDFATLRCGANTSRRLPSWPTSTSRTIGSRMPTVAWTNTCSSTLSSPVKRTTMRTTFQWRRTSRCRKNRRQRRRSRARPTVSAGRAVARIGSRRSSSLGSTIERELLGVHKMIRRIAGGAEVSLNKKK